MPIQTLKVGELAKRTGLTVRTLHHYDEMGLLKPSFHTNAGYRLYTAEDVARLQQIVSLRQLGFSLQEVGDCLHRPDFSPLAVIRHHLARLWKQIELERKLCERLEAMAARLAAAGTVSADEFLEAIEEMTMIENLVEKYFTPEQRALIQEAQDQAGEETLRQKQEEWAEVIPLPCAEMEKGSNPADANVQALAERWMELVKFSTGGDPTMKESLRRLWQEQGDILAAQFGSRYDSRPVWSYVEKAMAVMKSS